MIKPVITNEMLNLIINIELKRKKLSKISLPVSYANKLRKNSRKMSSYASNKIEGNPLSFEQAEKVIDDPHQHLLRAEQEIRNYYLALGYLSKSITSKEAVSESMILTLQKKVVEGESKEKIGYRKSMPPGVLFAVYDSDTGNPDYIPPSFEDIPSLIQELIAYINQSNDHPLIKAAIIHYQLVTIHPFVDGNGRTARLLCDYYLDLSGFGFANLGSLEEYFNYNLDEYYSSLQMGLPALYYEGRNNPPHPEIWLSYFLRMFDLYSDKVIKLTNEGDLTWVRNGISNLKKKDKEFLRFILDRGIREVYPKKVSFELKKTNKTIINWCSVLVKVGFLVPRLAKKRILSYSLSDLCLANSSELIKELK